MVPGASFVAGWNERAANGRRTDTGVSYARRGSLSLALFKDVPVGVHAAARQLRRARLRGPVKVEVLDPADPASFTATITLPPAARFQQVHQYAILPLTGTPRVRVRITPVSGGELHAQEPRLLAA